MSELGFYIVSRFRDNACLHYIPKKEKRRGRPRVKGDKIDLANLNLSCMEELHIDGLDGKAYTLEAYAKALKKKVRLVIWRMPGGKCKLFFSTKLSMTGEEVLKTYRTRFQIEFCYYDKYIIMQSKVRSMSVSQRFVRLLLTSTSHNNNHRPRSLSQSRRFLLFSQSLSESRLGIRSAYAFSSASRLAFESALA